MYVCNILRKGAFLQHFHSLIIPIMQEWREMKLPYIVYRFVIGLVLPLTVWI